jgi:diguanylate cyclase (GGDEF)-like protein
MGYKGRVILILIYLFIVLAWHSFYFLVDFTSSYFFMVEKGHYKWDAVLIPLFSPFIWLLGLQYDKARFLSEKDALTGLYNRRFVSQITPKLLSQINRTQEKLNVSLIDCNNFKQINDFYGHKTGDLVLKNISNLLLNSTRDSDIVARWGGDEFLIIAPYTDLKGTKVILNRIEKRLYGLSAEMGINISVSMGIANYPNDADNINDLLTIADRNMYELKLMSKQAEPSN